MKYESIICLKGSYQGHFLINMNGKEQTYTSIKPLVILQNLKKNKTKLTDQTIGLASNLD